jgi:hypothetical protein
VLPSLGERSVRQCTALDLCIPKVEITAVDDPETARWKGAADRLDDLEQLALAAIRPPAEDVRVPIGARVHVFDRALFADWIDAAKSGVVPINQRRERLRVLAQQELKRRSGGEDFWSQAGPLKSVVNACWPTQRPIALVDRMLPGTSGRRRRWTAADQFLVDEANTLLNGTPFKYGHVVVDEAQDHSAVALRVIGRRTPGGSITMVGDVAQSTTPAGQERWADVFAHLGATGSVADLTIGYRVPQPILDVANRLLPLTGVSAVASRSVRAEGEPPAWHAAMPGDVAEVTAKVVTTVKHRHRLTGVVAPADLHESIIEALSSVGLIAVDHVHGLGHDDVPLFGPEAVKGLEFDGVVVVNPHEILDGTTRGARLLYVAMTRAVQELAFVASAPAPAVIA